MTEMRECLPATVAASFDPQQKEFAAAGYFFASPRGPQTKVVRMKERKKILSQSTESAVNFPTSLKHNRAPADTNRKESMYNKHAHVCVIFNII